MALLALVSKKGMPNSFASALPLHVSAQQHVEMWHIRSQC